MIGQATLPLQDLAPSVEQMFTLGLKPTTEVTLMFIISLVCLSMNLGQEMNKNYICRDRFITAIDELFLTSNKNK